MIKNVKNLSLWGIIFVSTLFLVSCDPNNGGSDDNINNAYTRAVYVLNEGAFQMNNSTLSYYDFQNGKYYDNIFLDVNHRGLGDVGNDLQQYGSKLYCVVNNSNILEIMDFKTAKSLKTVALSGKQPRRMAFSGAKCYVSCFDGDVVKIDTATMEIEATVHTGSNPDGICVCNGKLYVANSGGLNYPNYSKTVSVIDLQSFTVIKDIEVTINPTRVKSYNDRYVYVVSNGNYTDIPYTFQKIDCQIDELVKTFDLEVSNFDIYQNSAYIYSYDYSTSKSWIKILDLETENIVDEQFIKVGTSLKTPYNIKVNPLSGDVWITDSGTGVVNGDVYCFDKHGKKKFSFQAGLFPSEIVFVK